MDADSARWREITPSAHPHERAGLNHVQICYRTERSISVGPWRIEPRPYDQGPTWQDHHTHREDIPEAYRRIRIYLYERESDPETRASIRRAAQREFSAGQGIQHPGLLVPHDLLDHERGPALVIEQEGDTPRLRVGEWQTAARGLFSAWVRRPICCSPGTHPPRTGPS
ncbi:MAG TPA: hypothetical protein VGJ13_10470 [Pseudonocardiaceae bacterium]